MAKAQSEKRAAVVKTGLSAAMTLTSVIVTLFVALVALATLGASAASSNPFAFPGACIFWAIVFSAWTINDKLNAIISLLRQREE